jgi:chorismate mutase
MRNIMTSTLPTATTSTAPLSAPVPVHRRTRISPETAIDATATPEEVPVPADQDGIDKLRVEIDAIDAELVRLILHRTAISHAIGTARKTLGGPKIVYSREMAILERFRALGPAGTDLGMLLLAMGRGKLGRK